MDIFDYLEEMQKDILECSLAAFEKKYYAVCVEKSGKNEAIKIQKVNMDEYRESMKDGISQALKLAAKGSAKVIYFEYDMDNGWNSNFFICDDYKELFEEDDEWACDWFEEVNGGSLEEFSEIYLENGFNSTNKALGNTLYLIARTVVLFSSVCQKIETNIPICIAFHDQDPIMRVKNEG
ncbi:hypothetical protein FIU87_03460 [Bacillus sp. THAF10]|uniref:hypothetical protein n=1 Tax=Bacillus sp. THAF10 TaxID=2587848 RepID=UPI0012695875|nr:hypothetical protein [Bacillus sp. THAF10]QFT87700.1 hypothetical protein FIU87_03460 [Bacillus sp. THAF10]